MGRDYDIFRDSWVRYLGYANEVGEALRPAISARAVHYSYGVAMAYVLCDTLHKSGKALKDKRRISEVLVAAGDALIWQTLASVAIPGLVINRISYFAGTNIDKYLHKLPSNQRKWMTIGVGLASIPVIIRPIDAAVTFFMDMTYRKIM